MLLRTLIRMHFITPYHIMHVSIYAFVISYFMLMHIGSSEEITLLEFTGNLFPQRQASEHSKPPMFYKISLESFMFDALGYKS